MGKVAAIAIALGVLASTAAVASAETRTLKMYNLHTREKAEITFKRNGRYDPAGLAKANNFLRDWRRNEPTKMDPRLLDLVWEAHRASGSRDYIHVIGGYRAPATNSMLRSRSKGVAQKSQHMLGKAMDFYIPDVKLKTLRNIGLKLQNGGVGYYPTSGSPFVHMDVGNVRHWPSISRKELVAVFPDGKTLHVPSDGKPLPGYNVALASYQSRKKTGTTAMAMASAESSTRGKSGGLLAALFGGGADEDEDTNDVAPTKPAVRPTVAAAKPSGQIAIVPPEQAEPAGTPFQEAAPAEQAPETIIASLPARNIPLPAFAPRPKAEVAPVVPFPTAQGGAPDQIEQQIAAEKAFDEEVAANIPLPTWRPAYKPEPQDTMLLAMAAPEAAAGGLAAAVPLPARRPDHEELTLASLAATEVDPAETIQAEVKDNNERLALLSPPTSPKDAVVGRPAGTDPVQALAAGAKTTRKVARANASDSKPDPKPLVVAAQPESARWALRKGEYVAAGATAPTLAAHMIVRTAPSEVYAAGFQQGARVADAGRFTGKAVSFMPVARFSTN